MAKSAAKTGVGPTALVAIEQSYHEGQRILNDELAFRIMPFAARTTVRLLRFRPLRAWFMRLLEKETPGMWSGMMCRKRYIDEKLITALGKMQAVVNLGAGFDTRAYRLSELSNKPVWEIDQPENIAAKEKRILSLFGEVPGNVRLVSIDFDTQDLKAVLVKSGFAQNKKTFFIWEAVIQYLNEAGVRATFDFLEESESGSQMIFTYVRKDFLNGEEMYGWEKGYQKYVVKDKLWHFGMNPGEWPDFLRSYGWKVVEDCSYHELAERYVKPTGRQLASMEIERILLAEKI